MNTIFADEFVKLANLVKTSTVPLESASTIDWCMKQLPTLYKQLVETYETRYSEKIMQLERGILGQLATEAKTHPDVEVLSSAVADAFRDLHERHGLRSLDPKPPRKTEARTGRPAS
jgi:hypothetical protein